MATAARPEIGRLSSVLTMQDALIKLNEYWTEKGCLTWQPNNTEVGAGTMNAATVLRVLGPEPWDVAYVEPSVRPDDSRYGENPNRLQTHTQYQVILKPEPGDPQELYLGSLEAIGIDLDAHDVRFVEDNWAQPAIGAWGLGWEVWLDGMEITQFTYFQQVGGQTLDPIPVELTYGMERIIMAQQGVTDFKDIVYAIKPNGEHITYADVFLQQEYEMSRYYIDEADVQANHALYEHYVAEAQRMIDARLPVPAHQYVLKSSHAFNIQDSRGAISTTERAKAFGTMRRLMRDTAALWIERREELGLPLMRETPRSEFTREPLDTTALPSTPQTLAVEIGVEELPPHVLPQTIDAVREALTTKLAATRLSHGNITVEGTPRRIVAIINDLAAVEPDAEQLRKGPKWSAAFDAEENPTRALQGFMRGQGVTAEQIIKASIGGNDHAAVAVKIAGRGVLEVASEIITETIESLRAEKNMRWNDPNLSFSRAIRWLVALWGSSVVPVDVSNVHSGRRTYLQRTTASTAATGRRADGAAVGWVDIPDADSLTSTICAGHIELSTQARRDAIIEQATALAAEVGGTIDFDTYAELVDEITNLVEDPHGVLGHFDERYLDLPEKVLVTVMRKHQRYLPVYGPDGTLKPHFVTIANGLCDDNVVRAGNESVIRARYEDALFFWNSDLAEDTLESFIPGLEKLTFENRLGSVGMRARRIADVATTLSTHLELTDIERDTLARAGTLAKFDLASKMVVEMSSLAGFVAREYARIKGETEAVATALAEMEEPHTSADPVPATLPGSLLALGDRFDLLSAMFAVGAKPTGSSDPYGLRRAALGVVRILREAAGTPLAGITIADGLAAALERLRKQGIEPVDGAAQAALDFTIGRYAQLLRDEGTPAEVITAILPAANAPGRAAELLNQITELMNSDSTSHEFTDVVATMVRIVRIIPAGTNAGIDHDHLNEPAEKALANEVQSLQSAGHCPASSSLTDFVHSAGTLVTTAATFFDDILVMAQDPAVKAARLGLLASVLDLAPEGIDWKAVDIALTQRG
ncbi:Glycine--tRNA ligase alpha subunit [Dermatophilus congolensis]|uniref:Multifunctional fusion protein n=1 Tax=Dermatophilus congolensis TaxID=1863 RepID=A0A239VAU4_9MICO|nr:glycine--tRNA ligase [Dermatophilus congolensis]SNV18828.1 Glycine--tRNA ligase alpha subunit [Dermatophilus congolensis]